MCCSTSSSIAQLLPAGSHSNSPAFFSRVSQVRTPVTLQPLCVLLGCIMSSNVFIYLAFATSAFLSCMCISSFYACTVIVAAMAEVGLERLGRECKAMATFMETVPRASVFSALHLCILFICISCMQHVFLYICVESHCSWRLHALLASFILR
jgi:hypothetical protein